MYMTYGAIGAMLVFAVLQVYAMKTVDIYTNMHQKPYIGGFFLGISIQFGIVLIGKILRLDPFLMGVLAILAGLIVARKFSALPDDPIEYKAFMRLFGR